MAPKQAADGPGRRADLPLVGPGVLRGLAQEPDEQVEVDGGEQLPRGGLGAPAGHPQELGGVVVPQLDDGEEVVGAQQGETVEDLAAESGYFGVDVGQLLGGVLDGTVPLSGEPREHDEPGHTDQLLKRQARAEAGCQYTGVGNMAGVWGWPEGLPGPLGLGEAVGDREHRSRVVGEAAVAADDFDVLSPRPFRLDARLPGGDAVGPAVDGGHRDRQWGPIVFVDQGGRVLRDLVPQEPVGELVGLGGVARTEPERRAEGDHLADGEGMGAGQVPGPVPAAAVTDQADLGAMSFVQLEQPAGQTVDDLPGPVEVGALAPAVDGVALTRQDPAQWSGVGVVGGERREHHDRVPVAGARQGDRGRTGHEGHVFERCSHLQRSETGGRRLQRHPMGGQCGLSAGERIGSGDDGELMSVSSGIRRRRRLSAPCPSDNGRQWGIGVVLSGDERVRRRRRQAAVQAWRTFR